MRVTLLGYLLLPIGVFLFLFRPKLLFYFFIFFSPFTAAAVVNVETLGFGVQPGHWFGTLWIIHSIMHLFYSPVYVKKEQMHFVYYFFLFCLVALASMAMPIFLGVNILVHYPRDLWGIFRPLTISVNSLTQYLYLFFAFLCTLFVMLEVKTRDQLVKSLKVFLYSGSFIILWGMFQFISYYAHLPYPYWIFNNNISYAQAWYQQDLGIKAITSVMPEGSLFALFIVMYMALVSILWIERVNVVRRSMVFALIVSSFLVLILILGSSAYLGFLLLLGLIILWYGRDILRRKDIFELKITARGRSIMSFVSMLIIVIVIGVVLLETLSGRGRSIIMDLLGSTILHKLSTPSGLQRTEAALESIRVFLQAPILGVGWGNNISFDLGTTLLSAVGLIGFFTFIPVIVMPMRCCIRVSRLTMDRVVRAISVGLLFSIVVGWFMLFIAHSSIIYIFFWFFIGLAMSLPNIHDSKIEGGNNG